MMLSLLREAFKMRAREDMDEVLPMRNVGLPDIRRVSVVILNRSRMSAHCQRKDPATKQKGGLRLRLTAQS